MLLQNSAAYQLYRQVIPKRRYRWLIYLGMWAIIAGFAALKRNFLYPESEDLPWLEAIRNKLAIWYLWGSTVIVITWLAAKFKVTKENWTKNAFVLIGLSMVVPLLFLCVWSGYFHLFYAAIYEKGKFTSMFIYALGHHSTFYYLFFWFVVGLEHAAGLHLKAVERAIAEKELKVQLAQAQLQNLKNQLQPHFIFNTMNVISSMIDSNPKMAREVLVNLGQLLRMSLNLTKTQETTLRKEIEFTGAYLDLQKARFDGRLYSEISIAEELKNALIPSLTIQPLVENVIKHAVEIQDSPIHLFIRGKNESDFLELIVEDNGPGMNTNGNVYDGNGIGVKNLQNRLSALYGDDGTLTLTSSNKGGVKAIVRVPLHNSDSKI